MSAATSGGCRFSASSPDAAVDFLRLLRPVELCSSHAASASREVSRVCPTPNAVASQRIGCLPLNDTAFRPCNRLIFSRVNVSIYVRLKPNGG